jgi:hypothetical protein
MRHDSVERHKEVAKVLQQIRCRSYHSVGVACAVNLDGTRTARG